jgi:serine/threonine-protein kinase
VIGTTLRHYRILEPLGAGGMGQVYRALDERLAREVAVKVLPPELLADEAHRHRFHREAMVLSRVAHPGIAAIHAFESDRGIDFIVMEAVAGRTLDAVLSDGPMAESEVRELGGQIAEALSGAHELGVVHRDLKPSNIMVTPQGRVKLLDFGLARLLERGSELAFEAGRTDPRILAGTLPYMAPEQMLGQESGVASDLYSLGAVLYEMATGRPPHRAELATALIYEALHKTPVPPAQLRPGLTAELDRLVTELLDREPARRPDARSVMDRLSRADGQPVAEDDSQAIRSLVVLPLVDHSTEPSSGYFADGMTEALITELARLEALRVISRTSSMAWKGSRRPLPEIARALRVGAVLEGSVATDRARVVVTLRLVDAATERTLWSERFDRPLADVLDLQRAIAVAVADGIRLRMSPSEQAHFVRSRPVSPRAYEAYVRGRFFWEQRSPEAVTRALESFQNAIEEDPTYALAWTGVADCHNIRGAFRWLRSAETFPPAKAAAQRALELDPDLAEAHTSLAFALQYHDWDWPAAGREFERALALQPGYATARQWYAEHLVSQARFDEALEQAVKASELDPLSPVIASAHGDIHYYRREYDRAVAEYRRALDLAPGFFLGGMNVARAQEEMGLHEEAIEGFRVALARIGSDPEDSAALAHAYAVAGQRASAERVLARVLERARTALVSPYAIASVYAGLGETDTAFHWLDQALAERDRMLAQLKVHPRLDPLRGDPRFERLLQAVGLAGTGSHV